MEPANDTPILDSVDINLIQKIVGTFLYYGIAVDNTILVALSTIASEQSAATSNTAKKITQLLNYLATNPDVTIWYTRSDMVLWVHSDASFSSFHFSPRPLLMTNLPRHCSKAKFREFFPLKRHIHRMILASALCLLEGGCKADEAVRGGG